MIQASVLAATSELDINFDKYVKWIYFSVFVFLLFSSFLERSRFVALMRLTKVLHLLPLRQALLLAVRPLA